MILDAYGSEIRRKIGFSGGLQVTRIPKRLVDRVSGTAVDLPETYEPTGDTADVPKATT